MNASILSALAAPSVVQWGGHKNPRLTLPRPRSPKSFFLTPKATGVDQMKPHYIVSPVVSDHSKAGIQDAA